MNVTIQTTEATAFENSLFLNVVEFVLTRTMSALSILTSDSAGFRFSRLTNGNMAILVQSLQSNQEATELLESARKSKEELQTELEKLQVCSLVW